MHLTFRTRADHVGRCIVHEEGNASALIHSPPSCVYSVLRKGLVHPCTILCTVLNRTPNVMLLETLRFFGLIEHKQWSSARTGSITCHKDSDSVHFLFKALSVHITQGSIWRCDPTEADLIMISNIKCTAYL